MRMDLCMCVITMVVKLLCSNTTLVLFVSAYSLCLCYNMIFFCVYQHTLVGIE